TRRPPRSPRFPYTTLFRSFALLRLAQAGDQREQGGLAGAVAAQQADAFACGNAQIDAVQRRSFGVGIAEAQVMQLKHGRGPATRSEEHTSELQSRENLVCR